MKYMRTTAAVLCVLLVCLISVPLTVFAAGATVTVGQVTARPGDTVTVPVTISRVEEVGGLEVHVQYDTAVLECVEATVGSGVSGLMMKNVNTTPVGHADQVWFTAIGNPTTVEGEVMSITFKVRDNAPGGDTALTLATDRLAVLVGKDASSLDVTPVDGAIRVSGGQADDPTQATDPTTTASAKPTQTTVKSTATSDAKTPTSTTGASNDTPTTTPTIPSGMVAIEDEQGQTVTRTDGEIVVVPSQETMADLNGDAVTNADGKPTMVQAVALMVDELTAKPGDTVTVEVSVSALAEVLTVGIGIDYDTKALTFEGGEVVGFVKDGMKKMAVVTENKKGTVDITAMSDTPVSGSGMVAQLRFTVNKNAYNGEYRLSTASKPFFQTANGELPVKYYAGEIRVEGGKEHGGLSSWLTNEGMLTVVLVIALPIAAVVLIAVVAFLVLKSKKTTE